MVMRRFLFLLPPLISLFLLDQPTHAIGDRSLYLTFDKTVYPLDETVKITIHIGAESCKQHVYLVDVYIYDSSNFLIFQLVPKRSPGISLENDNFPFTVTWTPRKTDTYIVKLYVVHVQPYGHPRSYLEDMTTLRVVSYLVTSQTTTSFSSLNRKNNHCHCNVDRQHHHYKDRNHLQD